MTLRVDLANNQIAKLCRCQIRKQRYKYNVRPTLVTDKTLMDKV